MIVRQIQTNFLPDSGEMGKRIQSFDWAETPVGPIEDWPESLKTAVRICISSRHPMVVWWGKSDLTQFYNDAYISFLGATKHPYWLGRSGRGCWSEIWHIVEPMLESVFETGEATWSEDFLFVLNRNLPREEGYFTFSYSPIWDDFGNIGGIFCSCIETTGRVIGERRLRTLRDLGRTVMKAKTGEEACELTAKTLAGNRADIPFALMYLVDDQAPRAHMVAKMGIEPGIEPGAQAAPATIDWNDTRAVWPLREVFETASAKLMNDLGERFESLPGGPWPESPEAALVLPIAAAGQVRPIGFFVAGLSPRQVVDADYRGFLDLIAGQVATAIANARAAEEERRRAAALAELDRAKTQFFSNVSHEFRTPLTLLLGPLETVLAKQDTILPDDRAQLETAHRNSLRLLRLVNSLLDFSRIEAGRIKAWYEPVDLASFTADLASNFRSAMEAGGLQLEIDCPPLPEPVYVDREMWEKIVLNLLSNAYKFTFEGRVSVSLRSNGGQPVFTVSDTGVGIPEQELPHIFERFHRVEASRGRTYEGTGIGLALIQELVKLHGGTVGVESRLGEGSAFRVSLPFGSSHLPPDQIGAHGQPPAANPWTAIRAEAFTGEAMTWTRAANVTSPVGAATGETGSQALQRPRILLADDNSDMREHLAHILGSQYDLIAVADGRAALQEAHRQRPDLILSDIMMPKLDGFGLLKRLRADPQLREVPVMLLSARAGEEARTDGIGSGADDYLTKPFSAAELNVRVRTMLSLQRIRRESSEAIAALNAELNSDLLAMHRMQQLSTRLVQTEELDALLEEILEAAIEITRADKGNIQLIRDGTLRICQQHGFEAPFLDFFNSVEYGNAVCGAAMQRGERVIVEEVAQSPIIRTATAREIMLAAGARAVQSTPLVSRSGRVFGIISTHYSRAPRRPTERELRLLDLLARQAADLIERNVNEAAIRAGEQRYRSLAEQVSDGIFIASSQGRYIDANRAGYEMLGYTLEELCTLTLWDVLAPEEVQRLPEQFERLAAGQTVRNDWLFRRKDRSVFTGELIGRQLPDGRFQSVVRDVTERRLAEQINIEQKRSLEMIASGRPLSECLISVTEMVSKLNPSLRGAVLVASEDGSAVAGTFTTHFPPSFAGNLCGLSFGALEIGTCSDIAGSHQWSPIWKSQCLAHGIRACRSTPIRGTDGRPIGSFILCLREPREPDEWEVRIAEFVANLAGIAIERDRAAVSLRRSEERFRGFVTSTSDVVYRMSPDWGEMRYLSGKDFIPDTENATTTWLDKYIDPADQQMVLEEIAKAIHTGTPFELEHRIRRVDGNLGWTFSRAVPLLNEQGEIVEWFGAMRDVTARKEAEEKFQQTQKLESLGVLAGGIAHDFNNLLTGMLGNASLLEDSLRGLPQESMARALVEASERMALLTQQMLAYSGKGRFVIEPLDLSHEVTRIATLIHASIPKDVELQLKLAKKLPMIEADASQIQQLIMNLVINAAEAIGSASGVVEVSTSVQKLEDGRVEGNLIPENTHSGSYILLSVVDNGCGMDEEMKRKIFDPFFTTKFTGRGLGLSAVLGIVRGHKGILTVDSSPGQGTAFKILLPVMGHDHGLADASPQPETVSGQQGTILVVDDEAVVLQVARTALEMAGYRVLTAPNGYQALEVFREHKHEVVLVILDLTMPLMSGAETLRKLLQIAPGALVVGSSGYNESNAAAQFGAGAAAYLQKPYQARRLLHKVSQLLEQRRGRGKSENV